MSDQSRANDPGAVWRDQPEEKKAVNLEPIVNRRTEGLYASTRSEILMSIGAAVLLAGIIAWRFAPAPDRLQELGLGAVLVWIAVTVYLFRRRIWRREPSLPETAAAPCVEYYRRELERRRDHLRNEWLWHGPLFLACIMLAATLIGKTFPGFDRLESVLPLLALLAVWTGFGFWRRRLQAKELQREIDEMQEPPPHDRASGSL